MKKDLIFAGRRKRFWVFRAVFLIALVIFSAACPTVRVFGSRPENPPFTSKRQPITVASGEEYLRKGLEFVGEPNLERFLILYNNYKADYPQESRRLLLTLKTRFLDAFDRTIDRDPLAALSIYRSFLAISGESSDPGQTKMEQQIVATLQSAGYAATAATLTGDSQKRTTASLNSYRDRIGVIKVKVSFFDNKAELEKQTESLGTGVIVDNRRVMTNFHVVESVVGSRSQKAEISLEFKNRLYKDCQIVSWDAPVDLALIECSEDLPETSPLLYHFGDSAAVRQGATVYAIGNHSSLTATMTKGIVSAVKRKAPEFGQWLQTDATLTGGASGGLLVGEDGLIYGILTAHLSDSENLGFAIPAATARRVLETMLLTQKPLLHGWAGLRLEEKNRFADQKVVIDYIFPFSILPEVSVGLGDQLTAINGKPVADIEAARQILELAAPGELARLDFKTLAGKELKLLVSLARRPDYPVYSVNQGRLGIDSYLLFFNITLSDDDSVIYERIPLPVGYGLYVEAAVAFYRVKKVGEDSPFFGAGVRGLDRIGILTDRFYGSTRVAEFVHWPRGQSLRYVSQNLGEYYIKAAKGKNDENLL